MVSKRVFGDPGREYIEGPKIEEPLPKLARTPLTKFPFLHLQPIQAFLRKDVIAFIRNPRNVYEAGLLYTFCEQLFEDFQYVHNEAFVLASSIKEVEQPPIDHDTVSAYTSLRYHQYVAAGITVALTVAELPEITPPIKPSVDHVMEFISASPQLKPSIKIPTLEQVLHTPNFEESYCQAIEPVTALYLS